MLYVFIVLSHDRRQVAHFNVTEHPTAQWTAQQLVEAFPFESAPRYLLRDRDVIYGGAVLLQSRPLSDSSRCLLWGRSRHTVAQS